MEVLGFLTLKGIADRTCFSHDSSWFRGLVLEILLYLGYDIRQYRPGRVLLLPRDDRSLRRGNRRGVHPIAVRTEDRRHR